MGLLNEGGQEGHQQQVAQGHEVDPEAMGKTGEEAPGLVEDGASEGEVADCRGEEGEGKPQRGAGKKGKADDAYDQYPGGALGVGEVQFREDGLIQTAQEAPAVEIVVDPGDEQQQDDG